MVQPLQRILEGVSEAEVRAISPHRARAHFSRFAIERGGGRNLTMLSIPDANAKIKKNATSPNPMARLSLQASVNLAPAGTSGVADVCGSCSTPGCRANCLSDSGRFSGDSAQRAQRIRTEFLAEHPDHAMALLLDEQHQHAENAWAQGLHPTIRRNTLSDVPWHELPAASALIGDFEEAPSGLSLPKEIKHLPGMTTTEYTKADMRDVVAKEKPIPFRSVSLTRSVSELTTAGRAKQVLESGGNLAVPVSNPEVLKDSPLASLQFKGGSVTAPHFNMDRDDARWADPERGHFGILREKKRGTFGSGAYALNPHDNTFGFVKEAQPGTETPVGIRGRAFREGHGR